MLVSMIKNTVQIVIDALILQFQQILSNPERRFAFLVTIGLALLITAFLLTDINRLNRIFYKPELSIVMNMINFCGLMCACFLFGFVTSKLTIWVKTGAFRENPQPKNKKGKKAKKN